LCFDDQHERKCVYFWALANSFFLSVHSNIAMCICFGIIEILNLIHTWLSLVSYDFGIGYNDEFNTGPFKIDFLERLRKGITMIMTASDELKLFIFSLKICL